MSLEDPQWTRASRWLAGELSPAPVGARLLGVLGAPLSVSSISPSNAHETPAALRRALRRFSTYFAPEAIDLADVAVADFGDLPIAALENEEAQRQIAAATRDLPVTPDLLVVLGGDNAVTRPALRGLVPDLSTAGLLTLDAHHDVRGFHAGPSNGTPVRGLIDEGLPGTNVVQIGIGAFTNARPHRTYALEQGITVIGVEEARAEGVGAAVTRRLDDLAERSDRIWVDLDVDVLDAAFAPGCPGARPGGLCPGELHAAAFAAGRHHAVVGIDIVEVDASADVTGITVDNAALCLLHAAAGLAMRPSP